MLSDGNSFNFVDRIVLFSPSLPPVDLGTLSLG